MNFHISNILKCAALIGTIQSGTAFAKGPISLQIEAAEKGQLSDESAARLGQQAVQLQNDLYGNGAPSKEWERIGDPIDYKSGARAAIYKNQKTGEVVVSGQGSDFKTLRFDKDSWDNRRNFSGKVTDQAEDLVDLVQQAQREYGRQNVVYSGYSLSGADGYHVNAETGAPTLNIAPTSVGKKYPGGQKKLLNVYIIGDPTSETPSDYPGSTDGEWIAKFFYNDEQERRGISIALNPANGCSDMECHTLQSFSKELAAISAAVQNTLVMDPSMDESLLALNDLLGRQSSVNGTGIGESIAMVDPRFIDYLYRLLSDNGLIPSSLVSSTNGLQDVTVSQALQYILRDFGSEDGDVVRVNLSLNGSTILVDTVQLTNTGVTSARRVGNGLYVIQINAVNEGAISPNTGEIRVVGDVVSGTPSQQYSLLTGESGQLAVRVIRP